MGAVPQAFVCVFLNFFLRCSGGSDTVSSARSILKALHVYGGQLYPEFSPTVFNYKLHLDRDTVDFPELEKQLVEPMPGGRKPSIILAPHIDDNLYGAEQTRLYIGRKEVPCKAGVLTHVGIAPEELLESALRDQGRIAYSLILVEVEAPHTGNDAALPADVEIEGGIQRWSYKFRVFHKISEKKQAARQLMQHATPSAVTAEYGVQPTSAPGLQAPPVQVPATLPPKNPNPGFAEVLRYLKQSSTIGLKLSNGRCFRTTGPLDSPQVTRAGKVLGLWKAVQAHIACFASKAVDDDDEDEEESGSFKFIASRFGSLLGGRGDFGFGDAISVGLRPEIATDAIWPLQDGVRSLGVPLKEGTTFRVIAVRAAITGQLTDLPVVTTRLRHKEWPVDLQFANRSVGACEPSPGPSGHRRFVCRAYKDIPEATFAQFVAFCEDCMPPPSSKDDEEEDGKPERTLPSVLTVHGGDSADANTPLNIENALKQQVASSAIGSMLRRPWAGWDSEVPILGNAARYILKVSNNSFGELSGRRLESKGPNSALEENEFEVFLIHANTILPWESVTMNDVQKDIVERAGKWLSQGALVAATMIFCVALMIVVLGIPNRLLALMPSLSVSVFALQLFIGLGSAFEAPEPVKFFCEPLMWLAPKTENAAIKGGLFVLAATLLAHAVVVCIFILHNGRGSAMALPHGLVFGSWELRMLGFLAFPMSSAAVSTLAHKLAADELFFFDYVRMLPSFTILVMFGWTAFWTWRGVTKALSEEQVILTNVPRPVGSGKGFSYPIFTDHYCDQLRAVPEEAGSSYFLVDWLSSPGWCLAPQVATIYRNEHRGGLVHKPNWKEWCSVHHNAPWRAQQRVGDVEDELGRDSGVVRLPSEFTLQKLGMTRAPSIVSAEGVYREVNERNSLMGGRSSVSVDSVAPLWNSGMQSECVVQHPVGVKTRFAYQCGRSVGNTVAGVRCLAWINMGVPATSLCSLEHHLQGEVPLRVQVGQLVGPITSGRLAACFEWGVHWPWNYSCDLMIKMLLGAWLAMQSHRESMGPVMTANLNATALLAAMGYFATTILYKPYAHLLDNAVAACGRFAMIVGVAMFLWSPLAAPHGKWWPYVYSMQFAAASVLAPLGLLIVGVITLTFLAFRDASCRTCKDANKRSEELLKKYAKAFDASSGVDLGKHSIDVLFQDMHPAPRLPAMVRMPVDYLRLQPSSNRRGEVVSLQSPNKPWISVVPSLIFPVVGTRNTSRQHVPIAAILEAPDDGRLLFAEKASNGGLEWKEVLRSFLNPIDEACAKEAERIISASEFPIEGALAERSLVIVELCPSDNTMTNLIR